MNSPMIVELALKASIMLTLSEFALGHAGRPSLYESRLLLQRRVVSGSSIQFDFGDGQPDAKFGLAGLGFEVDCAVVMTHEAADDVEPKTCAVSEGFGRKEWIEDTAPNLARNSGSVVEDSHHDVLVFAICMYLDATSIR